MQDIILHLLYTFEPDPRLCFTDYSEYKVPHSQQSADLVYSIRSINPKLLLDTLVLSGKKRLLLN